MFRFYKRTFQFNVIFKNDILNKIIFKEQKSTNKHTMKNLLRKTNEYLQKESLFGYLMHNTFETIVFIFVSEFAFLFLFKPYILVEYELKPLLILITGYSIIGSVSYALSFVVFSPHNKVVWTKKLEIGLFAFCYFIAWLLIWSYTVLNVELLFEYIYEIPEIPSLPDNFIWILLFYTVVIGIILYLGIHSYDILITHEKLGKQQKSIEYMEIRKNRLGCQPKVDTVKLTGRNENDFLKIEISQFVAAVVDGHYVKVFYLCCDGNFKHIMLRNTMYSIEYQLINFECIYRCHKSYIVNLHHIKTTYTITAKNKSFLTLDYYPEPIPVSPKKIGFLKKEIEAKKVESSTVA